jgi:hypothetical protein|tara:strand:- start:14 stop:775 length:762 start_codon:yes stop_codon:yes gene_type:complete
MKNQTKKDSSFFFVYTAVLFFIVLAGFAPTFFLRAAFDTPPIPLYLQLHGLVLAAWFLLLLFQAWLIRQNHTTLHKKLGYLIAAYGVFVIAGGLMATSNTVARGFGGAVSFDTDMADIDPGMGEGISYLEFISGVVWANLAAMMTFAVMLSSAIFFRRQSDIHKRLILVATVAIVGPALARIARLEFLGGEQGLFLPSAIFILLAAIIIYDFLSLGKAHRASLAGAGFLITVFLTSIAIARTEFGIGFVRGLA